MSPLIKITNEVYVRKSEVLALEQQNDRVTFIRMKHEVTVAVPIPADQVQRILERKEETTNETTD